ncbi:MAG: hypothetical protein DDT40_01171 [candidate division WS2 bacterium]|nr:hypothetical protein [Candidatus Psychracetigena formicireducens]
MRLIITDIIDREICHFATSSMLITSSYNTIYFRKHSNSITIQLPNDSWKRMFGLFRLSRRALRLDKCNVVPVKDGIIAIRQGKVFHYSENRHELKHVLSLKNCRNVLHQSIAVIDRKELYFGEYGSNSPRLEVPIYRSLDGGESWEIVFVFQAGKIKHVHGCYYDPFEKRIWVLTGDFNNECYILCADKDFKDVEWIGDGSQTYRDCSVFFEKDTVHWIMDSPLQDSYHMQLNRKTRTIEQKQLFPGPVWYTKRMENGYYLAATAQEIGPSVKDQYAHLMVSKDLEDWEDIYQFRHDGFPKRYFKFGVIGFADGNQASDSFYLFFEAIKQLDGKVACCKIED